MWDADAHAQAFKHGHCANTRISGMVDIEARRDVISLTKPLYIVHPWLDVLSRTLKRGRQVHYLCMLIIRRDFISTCANGKVDECHGPIHQRHIPMYMRDDKPH